MKKTMLYLAAVMLLPLAGAKAAGTPFDTFFDVQQGAIIDLLGPNQQGPVPQPTLNNAELSLVYTNFTAAIEAFRENKENAAQLVLNALNAAAAIMANNPDPAVRRDAALLLRNAAIGLNVNNAPPPGGGPGPLNLPGAFKVPPPIVNPPPPPPPPAPPGGGNPPNPDNADNDGDVISNPFPENPEVR